MFLAYLLVAALLILWGVSAYNRGVKLRNQADESWSGISVQLKRRYDLIPNLVNTVKGYAQHEQSTLEKVIEMRNKAQAVGGGNTEDRMQAENALSMGIRSIFALAESYPELKANQNFIELQRSLSEVEDNLQNARRYYNAVVRDNNNYVEGFPSMIVARIGGFTRYPFFEIEEQETRNIEVKF